MPVRLMENFRALFYAPFYATHALGFFKREGIEVELVTSSTPGDAVPKLLDGSIDISWGGPMRVMKARDQDPHTPLVCFGEVVSRDPFFLIGRSRKPFEFKSLAALKLATVAEVPTPWMCLQHDLRRHGIAPNTVPRIADKTMDQNYAALRAGTLDVMQAFEPYATLAEKDKAGDVLYAAASRGPTVYTAYIASRDVIARRHGEFLAVLRATAHMQQWLHAEGAEELTKATYSFFPDTAPNILTAAFQRYLDAGLWAREPTMSEEGFVRLAQSLHSGGFIARMAVYDVCVEASLNGPHP